MNDFDSISDLRQSSKYFRGVTTLINHWSRPAVPRSLYWYLTFEESSALHTLSRRYQRAISFPYYDSVPIRSLHMTLDRIAFEKHASARLLNEIQAAASLACQGFSSFEIEVSSVSGTRGAVGFEVTQGSLIRDLRDQLSTATLSVYPTAPVRSTEFHAHITIAYCNFDGVPVTETIKALESLGSLEPLPIKIRHASLVSLERRARSYEWKTISRVSLSG